MSLTYTWAKCNDGKWYREPLWFGEGWFICLDDDDPPELVVVNTVKKGKLDRGTAEIVSKAILIKNGFTAKIDLLSYFTEAQRNFAMRSGKYIFKKAFKFDLEITELPPPPHKYEKVADDDSDLNGTLYYFNQKAFGVKA